MNTTHLNGERGESDDLILGVAVDVEDGRAGGEDRRGGRREQRRRDKIRRRRRKERAGRRWGGNRRWNRVDRNKRQN